MTELNLQSAISRRRAIKLAGLMTGGVVAAHAGIGLARTRRGRGRPEGSSSSSSSSSASSSSSSCGNLPVSQIESILQTQGTVSNGVLSISQDRTDMGRSRAPMAFRSCRHSRSATRWYFNRCLTARR